MRPLLVIFAYSGMDDMIDRHWESWQKTGCDILLSFPVDAPCRRGGLAFEKSQHHGAEIMKRIFRTFEHVMNLPYITYYFTEADSMGFCCPPRLLKDGLHCFKWYNNDPNFKAQYYPHYCHGMNNMTLFKLFKASKRYEPSQEQGFQDRFIGMVCEENGIEMHHRPDLCYSRNLLETDEHFSEARQAIKNGVAFIHGVKHEWQMQKLLT